MMMKGTFASVQIGAIAAALGDHTTPVEELHVVARHQLLREALGRLGIGPGIVTADQFDLDARGQLLLVLFDIEAEALVDLIAERARPVRNR